MSSLPPLQLNRPPFLVWPVARREFYALIAFALILPLTWGLVIFGFRALSVLIMTLAGALLTHFLLKRLTSRGRQLIFWHSIMSALLIAALAQPLWPITIMFAAGAAVVALIWLFGGPGHEPLHAALIIAILLNLVVAYGWLGTHRTDPELGAVLARDRLFMGDLRHAAPKGTQAWPRSYEIAGEDAVAIASPGRTVARVMRHVAADLHHSPADPDVKANVQAAINTALARDLPSMDMLLIGVVPGPIAAVSGIAIVLAGLYLAYRNILRLRSVALFLLAVILGLLVATSSSAAPSALGGLGLRHIWDSVPLDEVVTLLLYELFSGDILFAAVFVLALPGAEPITRRGRRWYLIFAGLAAGFLHRANLPLPTTVLILLAFQPLRTLFDALLARKSWLSSARP